MLSKVFISISVTILILAGCGVPQQVAMRGCRGKRNVGETLVELSSQSRQAVALRAYGQCAVRYSDENSKVHRQQFPVKIWFEPPFQMRLQGDIAFDPRGLVLGTNQKEFWMSSKLGAAAGCYWGTWSRAGSFEKLRISPRLVLDAFGTVDIGDKKNWSLSKEYGFDVLTGNGSDGVVKKIYVDRCSYLIGRIEYINDNKQIAAVTELSKYQQVADGFSIPSAIKITTYPDSVGDVFEIRLDSVKPAGFSEKQRQRLFDRPRSRGFENIYEIIDGRIIKQKTEDR